MNVQKKMIMSAPEVLIPIFENRTPVSECTTIYELNSFASIWCVIENILLAMTNEGLGGVTYVPKNTISIKRILEVPEKYEIPAIIPFGYPDSTEKKIEQMEITVNEKIHINKF
jgi:nitroreductase